MNLFDKKPLPAKAGSRLFSSIILLLAALCPSLGLAGPGAHGPDGEHLDEVSTTAVQRAPRFESFTDSFELVGEVLPQQLILQLHDYQTNAVVADAELELETANVSASARFIAAEQHYLLDDSALLSALQQPGRHEIVLTIVSRNNADLLTASFNAPALENNDHEDHDHGHSGILWWSLPLLLLVFVSGVVLGRRGGAK